MLVSQYIYTACGRDRNGAFSVFSKSKDISEDESSEIREVMMYKAPPGLPYEPTEQEIEELFPKKFGYFFLSSGRACLAHVCYVGRVYSDLDTRPGNYIIHAFVFNKAADFSPYSFIENNIFKRLLTRKEWHDDPIPDELPKIEIPDNGGMLSASEVNSFFNEDRRNKLAILIDAVLKSTDENSVCFNDDHKNQKYWFKILSLCLPKEIQNNISFCSHFTNTIVPGNISSRIQLKVNRTESSQFSYAQEAQRGRPAFDFQNNTAPPSQKLCKYANNIINHLSSGIFDAVKYSDSINKIISVYSVNINEASDLFSIFNSNYSDFENAAEFYNAILLSDRVNYEKQSIANNLITKKSNFIYIPQQRLGIYSFIYRNITAVNKKLGIIKTILEEPEKLEIQTDAAVSFRDDIKLKAGFIFEYYHDFLKHEGLDAYIMQNQASFIKLFLMFDFLSGLSAFKNSIQTYNFSRTENSEKPPAQELMSCRKIMELSFNAQSVSNLDILINSANAHFANTGVELLSFIVHDEIKSGKVSGIKYSFEILLRLRAKKDFAYYFLLNLVKNESGREEFIKTYINAGNNIPDFFTAFENDNRANPIITDFNIKKDAYCFMNQPLSLSALSGYFEKYYITGAGTELFIKRLDDHLSSVHAEKKINECKNILNMMKFPPETKTELIVPVYICVLEAFFSVDYDVLFDFLKKDWIEKINEIYSVVIKYEAKAAGTAKASGGKSLKQDTRELIILTLCGIDLGKYDFKEKPMNILSFFSKTQPDADKLAHNLKNINSVKNINIFIDYYFQPAVNLLILGATAANQFPYEEIITKAFGHIIEKGDTDKILENIIYGIKQTKTNSVVFILFLFRKLLSSSSKLLDKNLGAIAEKYFEKLSSGERKRKFSELLEMADKEKTETEQFIKYFDEFNKIHKGGFFNFFKNNFL